MFMDFRVTNRIWDPDFDKHIRQEQIVYEDLKIKFDESIKYIKENGISKIIDSYYKKEIVKLITNNKMKRCDLNKRFQLLKIIGIIENNKLYTCIRLPYISNNYTWDSFFEEKFLHYNIDEILDKICYYANTNRNISLFALTRFLGINPEHIFQRYEEGEKYLTNNSEGVELKVINYPIKSIFGETIQKAYCLVDSSKYCIFFSDKHNNFGTYKIKAELPNLDQLNKHEFQDFTISFFLSSTLTWNFLTSLENFDLYENKVIITGILGNHDEMDFIDIDMLLYREVIIICFPELIAWTHIEKFIDKIKRFQYPLTGVR